MRRPQDASTSYNPKPTPTAPPLAGIKPPPMPGGNYWTTIYPSDRNE
jgi:hypothetical protein